MAVSFSHPNSWDSAAARTFFLAWSMIQIPYFAWSAEVTGEYDERTRVATFQTVATSLALLLVLILPTIVDQVAPANGRLKLGVMGGLLGSSQVGSTLKAMLEKNADQYTWVAAAIGSNSAAGYQLATGDAVMPIGGFNGSDPSPTLAEFKKLVAEGKIHYFIGGSVGAANGGSNASSQIASWVAKNFTAKTVNGVTVYDLTS